MVCFEYIVVNTTHKGGGDDDDNCNLYCSHPVVLYDEAFNRGISFLSAQQYIVVYYNVNIVIMIVNDFLV